MAILPFLLFWVLLALVSTIFVAPFLLRSFARIVGRHLRLNTQERRSQIYQRVRTEETKLSTKDGKLGDADVDWYTMESDAVDATARRESKDWDGIVGFFHPFCNAGGGGERVLWAAIKAIQTRWPKAICVVYTGDHNIEKTAVLSRVADRFNIHLHPPTVVFLYLSTRYYVLSSTYPHLTLLGQSLGSVILAYDAFQLLIPDIFIDTMGYAFALAFSKLLFPKIPTGAYVHYPTISTDMLDSLNEGGQGLNAGTGKGLKGLLKRRYWRLFSRMYGWSGGQVDVVMTNSSWTRDHIRSLWGPSRSRRGKSSEVDVVFPPVAVEELEEQIEVSLESENQRERIILYIAQFRPEKNHAMILEAFSSLVNSTSSTSGPTRLVLVGSVRNSDDAKRVYELRLLAHELKIKDVVDFVCDAPWPNVLDWLRRSWVGVNGMWNEHFGIGVVEYQAAGLISVVHDSGGPKADIIVVYDGGPTGFHATTKEEFTEAFEKALSMSPEETLPMRLRARASAKRFTEGAFAERWIGQMQRLVDLQVGVED
ncbi:MAG: asparagine-linked glycosylation protein [Peltula sp. TS41687]|nr:MAG: asparagine-linked glycosylation protein [Peltula sp. TS41687]